MHEKLYEINSISYQIRIIGESDLDSLMSVISDASVHIERFRQQKDGKGVYLGAFINNYAVGEIHLDGVYEYTDEQGNQKSHNLSIFQALYE